MSDPIACRLSSQDRPQRTLDFRALFRTALIGRTRDERAVRWRLNALPGVENESLRLADLERRCCEGITFEIHREDDVIVWTISGPAGSAEILDALYDLPEFIQFDDGAGRVWDRLDAAACDRRAQSR